MSEFFENGIRVIPLTQWLDWASGQNAHDENNREIFVALPMIQRGSVWKPLQIINLWDSMLRGMPLGSLLVSHMPPVGSDGKPIQVRRINQKPLSDVPPHGGLGLIDGQQRTLSMLLGWPGAGEQMDRRIWIDLADEPSDESQFRFHVTTSNQPFGFQRYAPNSKLPLSERRKARDVYGKRLASATGNLDKTDGHTAFRASEPWESVFPLDLFDLIRVFKEDAAGLVPFASQKLEATKAALLTSLQILEASTPAHAHIERRLKRLEEAGLHETIQNRLAQLSMAMQRLFEFRIPLIEVPPDYFEDKGRDEKADPPLAVLFKRIGTGGTPLSDADYVYSVIKHRLPESYVLVETLSQQHNIGGLLSAPDIVMTAVRLAAAECDLTDWESPSKADFHRLQNNDKFLAGFVSLIGDGGRLHIALSTLTQVIAYVGEGDCGLPKHALSLLNRPLIQVLLRWVLPLCDQHPDTALEHVRQNRAEIVRFIMYWVLCVSDQRKASTLLFKDIKQTATDFPGGSFAKSLHEAQVAVPMISPETLAGTGNIVFSSPEVNGLRGWKRFHVEPDSSELHRSCVTLYSRWWNLRGSHVHPILLWLQRSLVDQFEGFPAAGRDEETPYDYDHICPSNHWHGWTGVGGKNRLIDFHNEPAADSQGHWRLGNSIGNVRVWDSSDNRSLGDASPRNKLPLEPGATLDIALLSQSLIETDEISDWLLCSGEDDFQYWTKERALAFQRAIERRAFNLYRHFYQELGFGTGYAKT